MVIAGYAAILVDIGIDVILVDITLVDTVLAFEIVTPSSTKLKMPSGCTDVLVIVITSMSIVDGSVHTAIVNVQSDTIEKCENVHTNSTKENSKDVDAVLAVIVETMRISPKIRLYI